MSHNLPGNRRRSRKASNPPPDPSCWPDRVEVRKFLDYLALECHLQRRVTACSPWAAVADREDAFQKAVLYFYDRAITGYIQRLWNFQFSEERAQKLSQFAISYIRRVAFTGLIDNIRRPKPQLIGSLNEIVSIERRPDKWQEEFWDAVSTTLSPEELELVKRYVENSFNFSQTANALGWSRTKVTQRLKSIFAKLALTVDQFLDGQ